VDHTTWRWIFYINIPVGIGSLFLSSIMVEDPPWLKKEKDESKNVHVDWLGLGLVAVAFGSLQLILDKGQEDDWFHSPMIVVFTMAMVICMLGMVVWERAHPNPIVNVRLYRNPNFAMSTTLMFTIGAVLYGTTVLIPLFLQTLMGYSAERAGMVLSPGGLMTMAMMPVVGFLVSKVPAKYLIAAAFAGLSLALFHMSGLNLNIDPRTATMYRIYQAATLAFLFIPINVVAYIGVPREQNNQVSGMMNLARNIGGSVGIAYVSTTLARRSQTSQQLLVDHLGQSNLFLQDRLDQLQRAFSSAGPAQAMQRAYATLYGTIQQQAALLSYVRIIETLAIICAVFVPLILLLVKKNEPGGAPAGAH
jgi:DHA2 family multidrug resistance protein